MEGREAIGEVVSNALLGGQLSPSCCDISNEEQQTESNDNITQVSENAELVLDQQVSELKRQVSLQSQQLEEVTIKLQHVVYTLLMLQRDDRQMEPSNKQDHLSKSCSLSATEMQQTTTTECQALMNNTYQCIKTATAMAAIEVSSPNKLSTENLTNPKQNTTLMPPNTGATLSAINNKAVETLMLERLEQLANGER